MVWDEGESSWVGSEKELPAEYRERRAGRCGRTAGDPGSGGLPHPSRVCRLASRRVRAADPGAHAISRSRAGGGGIASTVRQTRAATEEQLVERAAGFLEEMLALGVTTVECKSGYGLDEDNELKLLRVYRRLAGEQPVRLVADLSRRPHGPPGIPGEPRRVCRAADRAHDPAPSHERGLAACCDVFVEESAFTIDEARRILRAGQAAGLAAKLHADQLTSGGGAELAAELGALSADHLERISRRDRSDGCRGCRRGEPAAGLALPPPASDAGAPADRGGSRRCRCDGLQPRLGPELSPSVGADPGVYPPAA